jgi:N-acetylated-alpha-linked acidic dipeptidase
MLGASAAFFSGAVAPAATPMQANAASLAALEQHFDATINPDDQRDWMKIMASEPNHVGSPHDKINAEWELAQFKSFGWDAHIEEFDVLYPTPIAETVEMLGARPFKAVLQEPPIPGDTSSTAKDPALPAYLAYQGDGDVTAPLVYVNYGMQDDYKALARMGIDVKGKIVIARYGHGWRGLKPLLAQQHGAIGCLIYSDPADDGYGVDGVYPGGPARPPEGIQRGSVEDMSIFNGDPLTPDVGATKDAKRLTRQESPVILKIPALPISYADALPMLKTLTGDVAPENWRGGLAITYRVGPSSDPVHLAVKSDWSLKPVYDVIAKIEGSQYPGQWIIRGNHHDGWVEGASDPLAGQVAQLDEAKAFGALLKQGWRPKRTIVYASWDGEEPGLLGSTEWAETHAGEIKDKAVLYINTDTNARGTLFIGGNHDLEHFVDHVTDEITDPETHVSVNARRRAKLRVDAMGPGADPDDKADAKLAADPKQDMPIEALGSGSDFSVFLEHLGIATLDLGYGGEGDEGGVYHSRYDTFEHHSRFVDPGFVYGGVMAKTVGHMVIEAADTGLPLARATDFADVVARYLKEIETLTKTKREAAEVQAKALADNIFALADDPTKTHGPPAPLKPVPPIDLKPLSAAVARLQKSSRAYDAAVAKNAARLSPAAQAKLMALVQTLDETLAPKEGLPGREWYRNLVYAPGRFTGYGVKTLPGVREAIEDQRWSDANTYAKLTADALNAYSARLDQATAVFGGR